jgi:hypothetical protein
MNPILTTDYESAQKASSRLPDVLIRAALIGALAQTALGTVASIGGTILLFVASFIVAGIALIKFLSRSKNFNYPNSRKFSESHKLFISL